MAMRANPCEIAVPPDAVEVINALPARVGVELRSSLALVAAALCINLVYADPAEYIGMAQVIRYVPMESNLMIPSVESSIVVVV